MSMSQEYVDVPRICVCLTFHIPGNKNLQTNDRPEKDNEVYTRDIFADTDNLFASE